MMFCFHLPILKIGNLVPLIKSHPLQLSKVESVNKHGNKSRSCPQSCQNIKYNSSSLLSSLLVTTTFFEINVFQTLERQHLSVETVQVWTIFQGLRPSQVIQLNDLRISFPEKQQTDFKSLFRVLPSSKAHLRNHRLLYVSRGNLNVSRLNL